MKNHTADITKGSTKVGEQSIGLRLKRVRTHNNLSQRQLGRLSGVANATISQIENGRLNPTVGMLKKVLSGIPYSLAEFFTFDDLKSKRKVFFTKSELVNISDGDVQFEQIGGNLTGKLIQLMRETYQPDAHTGRHSLVHEGEECGIVLSGRLTVTVGEQKRTLKAGESYYFDSSIPHHFKNEGREICQLISACTPPSF